MTLEKRPPITDEAYLKSLFNVLDKYYTKPIQSKSELRRIFHKCTNKKNFVSATRNLIHYLVDRDLISEDVAVRLLSSDFLKAVKTGVREIYLTDREISEGLKLIEQKWDAHTVMLYKFIVFTGVRVKPAVEALTNFEERKLEFNGNVAVYPLTESSKGSKRNFIAVMPVEFAKSLYKLPKLKISSWRDRLNTKRWKPRVDSRVDPNAVRKWCDNFFVLHGIPESVSDFMQGRAKIKVGSKHYLHMRLQAMEHYRKVVDKFPF